MKKSKFTVIDDDVFGDVKVPAKNTTNIINNSNNNVTNRNDKPRINTINGNDFSIKSQIYKAVSTVYNNYMMTKTGQYDNFGVYKALVECNICTDIRYIVAIVDNDSTPIGYEVPLSELNWVSFQTRMTKNSKEFKTYYMRPRSYTLPNKSILHDKITRVLETKEKTVYTTDNLPLTIEVIHNTENDTFTDKGTVIAALELFQTVITFNE
jgi:hypothetical protein